MKTIKLLPLMALLLLPAAFALDASGTVNYLVGTDSYAVDGAVVNVTNQTGDLIASVTSASDGSYTVTGLLPLTPYAFAAYDPVSGLSKSLPPVLSTGPDLTNINFNLICPDSDSDGYYSAICGGNDCNDAVFSINPGAADVCNGIDDDCDALTADGSGELAPLNLKQLAICAGSTQVCTAGSWIDDYSAVAGYEDPEFSCDGIDNDCDGNADIGLFPTFYADADNDTYGDSSVTVTDQCTVPAGYVADNTDCNDADAAIKPGAIEICGNGIDENCNGDGDDACPSKKSGSGGGSGHSSAVMPPGWYPSSTAEEGQPDAESTDELEAAPSAPSPAPEATQPEYQEEILPTTGEAVGFFSGKSGARNLAIIIVIIAAIAIMLATAFFRKNRQAA